MAKEPIRRIVLGDGKTVRYRLVVDLDPDPETGVRRQFTGTYDKIREARKELSRIRHERATGTLIAPSGRTLDEELDAYIRGLRGKSANTLKTYQDVLKPARTFLGGTPLQQIDKALLDGLVDWMQEQGRSRTSSRDRGAGHGPQSVCMTLGRLQAALEIAVRERRIGYNPVRLVERPKIDKPVHDLWSDAEEEKFFAVAGSDRIAAVIELFARGLRPEEVCGQRWRFTHLAARNASVGDIVRTMVNGQPHEKAAKTPAGIRILPLDDGLIRMLAAWRDVQRCERETAADMWYRDPEGGYVLADELGVPFTTQKLRRYMYTLMDRAGVRQVTPYEAMRHAAGSRMARAGVPGHVIAAWMGHTKASFTYDNYVHARPEDLAAGRDALERGKGEQNGVLRPVVDDRVPGPREAAPPEARGVATGEQRERQRRGRVAGQRRRTDGQGGRGAGGGVQGDSAR